MVNDVSVSLKLTEKLVIGREVFETEYGFSPMSDEEWIQLRDALIFVLHQHHANNQRVRGGS